MQDLWATFSEIHEALKVARWLPILQNPLRREVGEFRAVAGLQFLANAVAVIFDGLDAHVHAFGNFRGLLASLCATLFELAKESARVLGELSLV